MRLRDTMTDQALEAHRATVAAADERARPALEAALEADVDVEPGDAEAFAAPGHGPVAGAHSHSHPAYGPGGSHEHMHRHGGDAHHDHDHADQVPAHTAAAGWPAGQASMVDDGSRFDWSEAVAAAASEAGPGGTVSLPVGPLHVGQVDLRGATLSAGAGPAGSVPVSPLPGRLGESMRAAAALVADGTRPSLVAAALDVLGSPWGIEQRGDDAWELVGGDGDQGSFASYNDAIAELGGRAFADGTARPVLAETWRSDMAFEDVETGDGRYIAPGALAYRAAPLPLMLQVVNDIGHFGAVLAGQILTAATVQGVAVGSGEFDDSEAGVQFRDVITARGRFGVSVDGISPVEAEYECVEHDQSGECTHERVRFTLLTVGGLTGTPFPAFADAYIALEQRAAQAASAQPEGEGEPADGEPPEDPPGSGDGRKPPARPAAAAPTVPVGKAANVPVGKDDTAAGLTAAAPGALPPAAWFADPEFVVGDGRLVAQPPDGRHLACPLTVLPADGTGLRRVYGHMAGWFTCHTGILAACTTAPRSKTGYAAYLLRPLMTAEGTAVRVGHLTMGCGHAPTDRPMAADAVRAHYDGGPGAVRMAQVAVGEDAFGIWFAGCIDPAATEAQVREFEACSVSGDWREVWRGRGLDLVACLAGVTVPGFPIASALAAAGLALADVEGALPADPGAFWVDGHLVALVAAGVVRRPLPWEPADADLSARVSALEARLARTELTAAALRPLAAGQLAGRLTAAAETVPANGNGSGS